MCELSEITRLLCSFGLDSRGTLEALEKGRLDDVLLSLQKEESRISLRRMELEDLREALIGWAKRRKDSFRDDEEISDEDMEFLSAAGEARRMDP